MENFDPTKESEGLGDTIAKVTNFLGIDKVAEGLAKLAGKEDCGCNRRRELLNELFPYTYTVREFKVVKDFTHGTNLYKEGMTLHITKESTLHRNVLNLVRDGMIKEV